MRTAAHLLAIRRRLQVRTFAGGSTASMEGWVLVPATFQAGPCTSPAPVRISAWPPPWNPHRRICYVYSARCSLLPCVFVAFACD